MKNSQFIKKKSNLTIKNSLIEIKKEKKSYGIISKT